jgi:hypothetical protein
MTCAKNSYMFELLETAKRLSEPVRDQPCRQTVVALALGSQRALDRA